MQIENILLILLLGGLLVHQQILHARTIREMASRLQAGTLRDYTDHLERAGSVEKPDPLQDVSAFAEEELGGAEDAELLRKIDAAQASTELLTGE